MSKLSLPQLVALKAVYDDSYGKGVRVNTMSSLVDRGLVAIGDKGLELTDAGKVALHVCIQCGNIFRGVTDVIFNKLGMTCDDCYLDNKAKKQLTEVVAPPIMLPCYDCDTIREVLPNRTFKQHTRETSVGEQLHRGMTKVHCEGSGRPVPQNAAQYS